MKKSILQLSVISTIVLFVACQKESSSEPSKVTNKVKTYIETITSTTLGNSVRTYNLTFDGSDRIISMISATNPGNKFLFSYNSKNTYSTDIYVSNALDIHEDFFLKNNLSCDSTFQYDNTGDTTTEKYFYNGTNLPVKLYNYNYTKLKGSQFTDSSNYSYDAKGNLSKEVDSDGTIGTYEYYPDMVYILPNVQPYAGQITNDNLTKTHTVTSNGSFVASAAYTYTFDSNHRISTETLTTDDGTIEVKTFIYF